MLEKQDAVSTARNGHRSSKNASPGGVLVKETHGIYRRRRRHEDQIVWGKGRERGQAGDFAAPALQYIITRGLHFAPETWPT